MIVVVIVTNYSVACALFFAQGDELLGAKAVLSMLIFSTVSGVLMSLFLNNSGGGTISPLGSTHTESSYT
jgi:hypothetical protein